MYLVMANGIRTGEPRGFNKGRCSKFCVGFRVLQTPEESRMIYRRKRYENDNKDEDNSLKTLNNTNHQASSKNIQTNVFWQFNCVFMRNWIVWNITDFCVKINLAIDNLKLLICHKTQRTNQSTSIIVITASQWILLSKWWIELT